ncbi:hypothetical protein RB2083_1491 [Rhodobacteraceae bacterium HTCC2083]|jgi:hypothetical protein|nr:hypothetical protein RB2083_1491 [Rhodobacteraceae bacterium HTCC2083]
MTAKTLYIHIGTHKTGSTAVQAVFQKNGDRMMHDNGIQFVPFPNEKKGTKGDIFKAIHALSEDVAENEDASKFLVSSEALCGLYYDIGDEMPLDGQFYRSAGQIAQLLYDALSPISLKIQIILCVRRQDDFLESAYKQTIQSGGHSSSEDFLATMELGKDFRWDALAASYASVFGEENISIINYDMAVSTTGILNSIGEIIGVDMSSNTAPRKNVSYSARAVAFAKEVHPFLTDLQKKKLRFFLQRDVFDEKDDLRIFDPMLRAEIYEKYKASNRALAEKFNIVQDTPDGLFQPYSGSQNSLVESPNIMLAKSMVINREALEAHSRLKKAVDEQALEIMDLRAEIKAIMRQINDS